MTTQQAWAERTIETMDIAAPDGYLYCGVVTHPTNGRAGVLVHNWGTKIYVIWDGQSMMSVPQDWALDHDAERIMG